MNIKKIIILFTILVISNICIGKTIEKKQLKNFDKNLFFSYNGKIQFVGKPLDETVINMSNYGSVVFSKKITNMSFSINVNLNKNLITRYIISSRFPANSKYWSADIAEFSIDKSGKTTLKELPGLHKFRVQFVDTLGMTNFYKKKPLLKWKPIEGAKYYIVSQSEKSFTGKIIFSNPKVKTLKSEYQIENNLIRNRKYDWTVNAYNISNEHIGYNSFRISGKPVETFFQLSIFDNPEWLHYFPNQSEVYGLRLNLPYGNSHNSNINGLDLGIAGVSKNLNGVGIGVVNIAENLNGINIGGIVARANYIYGVNVGGIATVIDNDVNGVAFGGIGTAIDNDVNGVAFGGIGTAIDGDVNGVAFGGIGTSIDGDVNGVVISSIGVDIDRKTTGIIFTGFGSACKEMTGVQISGIFNSVDTIKGLQIGTANLAKEGIQIGIYNHNTGSNGWQFGLLNYNKNGFFKIFPFINFGWNK